MPAQLASTVCFAYKGVLTPNKENLRVRLAYATYGLQTGRTLQNYEGILDTDPPPRTADKSLTAAPLDVIDQPAVDLERACELFPH